MSKKEIHMAIPGQYFWRISGTRIWRAIAFVIAVMASDPAMAAPVDALIKSEMAKMRIPGLSVAVIKNHKIVKLAGYGLANVETKTPATADTVYKIASLSKQFIASAILLLVEDHKIALDDKVSQYLDGTPEAWKNITIRHLLTHTSGIPRDPTDYHPYKQQTPMEVVGSAYSLPLLFEPGEKFLYSNVGYFALAEVIEKASGEPWERFVSERLFAPAGLTSLRPLTAAIVPNRASGYDQENGEIVNAENWIALRPSAAFLSTVRDLAKWDVVMDMSNPLSAASQKQMWTPATLNDGRISGYGLGWYIESYLGRARIHHDGQYPGFRSDYERFVDDKLTVIILANAGGPSVESLALKVAGLYVPALEAPPFSVSAKISAPSVEKGTLATIDIAVTDKGKAAPNSVLEMEIWDASNKAVHKQSKTSQDFAAGETKTYDFSWTPTEPGKYWINLGVYGPKWTPSYSWNEHMTTLTVN